MDSFDDISFELKDAPFNASLEDEFSELAEAIGNARIVILGQQTYRDSYALTLKSRIIRYLHEQKGFNVFALESGSFDVERTLEENSSGADLRNAARGALFHAFTDAEEIQPFLDYLCNKRSRNNKLRLVGFDTQQTGKYSYETLCTYLRKISGSAPIQAGNDDEWSMFESITRSVIQMSAERPEESVIRTYLQFVARLKQELMRPGTLSEKKGSLLNSFAYWARVLAGLELQAVRVWNPTNKSAWVLREKSMADYLFWLANNVFGDEKIIVWSHSNTHALRLPGAPMMATALSATIGQELITIGFTASRGEYIDVHSGAEKEIPVPSENSLENILGKNKNEYNLLNLRSPALREAARKINGWRIFNYQMSDFPLLDSFDMIIHAKSARISRKLGGKDNCRGK